MEESELISLAERLGQIGLAIEKHFGISQDIEGAIYQDTIYIVQTRPQI